MEIEINKKVREFIIALEDSTKKKTAREISLLEKYGYLLGMPSSKRLGRNLYELRIRGQQEVRLFYCFKNGVIFIIHGIIKKSQKIPRKELLKATKLVQDLLD